MSNSLYIPGLLNATERIPLDALKVIHKRSEHILGTFGFLAYALLLKALPKGLGRLTGSEGQVRWRLDHACA
jgi:hypothetical protein